MGVRSISILVSSCIFLIERFFFSLSLSRQRSIRSRCFFFFISLFFFAGISSTSKRERNVLVIRA